MSVTSQSSPISPSEYVEIDDLIDLREFYIIMKTGPLPKKIKCVNNQNGKIKTKTIMNPEFVGPPDGPKGRDPYVTIKYKKRNSETGENEKKTQQIKFPQKNATVFNKCYYSKNMGGSRKFKKSKSKKNKSKTKKSNKSKRH